jgi:hypothetical protein
VVEQVLRAHEHPRRAIAALESVERAERLLQGLKLSVCRQPFHGLDARSVGLDGEHHAALDRDPVDDHGAGTAVAGVAADVGPGQVEIVPNEVHEQATHLDVALMAFAVDLDRDSPAADRLDHDVAFSTARTATISARCLR